VKNSVPGVHLWLVMMKAFHAVEAQAGKSLKNTGLGDSDFRVLEVLLHKGPLPVNTIGPKVHLTPGSISIAVDRLYTKGLVTRSDSEEDRRVRIVALTSAGRTLITRVFRRHQAVLEKLAEPLSEKERLQLVELLKKLGKHAQHYQQT
jgi:MarR family transcriptional regulator, 2-MHQ and catechol-resistance regulon repressor